MKRLSLLAVLVVGCGGGTGGGNGGSNPPPYVPTNHSLDDGQGTRALAPGQEMFLGPFAVPAGATISYSILDTPTGIGSDSMDFAVVLSYMSTYPPGTQVTGVGVEAYVATVQTATPPLAAGSYDLYGLCRNLVDHCLFTDTVTAYY